MNTQPLADLLKALADREYQFTTPTPSTCRRMADKPLTRPADLRDIFGWSRRFTQADLEPDLWTLVQQAGVVIEDDAEWRCRVRVSRVHERLFLHSAFPATAADAVFLGPDSYRFADLIAAELASGGPIRTVLDVGTGAGVGGLVAERYAPDARIILSDINPNALELTRINAGHAGADFEVRHAAGLEGAQGELDLIVSNPPYVAGQSGRTYKDGGDLHGARLSLDWAIAGMRQLWPPAGDSSSTPAAPSSTAASTSSGTPWNWPSPTRAMSCATANWTRTSSPASCGAKPMPTPSGSPPSAR